MKIKRPRATKPKAIHILDESDAANLARMMKNTQEDRNMAFTLIRDRDTVNDNTFVPELLKKLEIYQNIDFDEKKPKMFAIKFLGKLIATKHPWSKTKGFYFDKRRHASGALDSILHADGYGEKHIDMSEAELRDFFLKMKIFEIVEIQL